MEEAYASVPYVDLATAVINQMLSETGAVRSVGETPTYQKYLINAYLNGSLVDRIVFVCRNS